jgi:hypothetical protein
MAAATSLRELRRPPAGIPATVVVAVVVAGALLSAGCGRKDAPLPPVIRVAETTRDLAVVQEGSEAVLTWSWPALTTAGGPLPDVEQVEIWRARIPAGQEPQGTSPRDDDVRIQLLQAKGERVQILEGEQLDDRTRGATLLWRDDLSPFLAEMGGEGVPGSVLWYGVRTVCCGGRRSRFSNIARLVPGAAPSPPEGLRGEPGPDGITLSWEPTEEVAVAVERSEDGQQWRQVSAAPVTASTWTDGSAGLGGTWSYRLRAVRVLEGGAVVRGPAGETVTVPYPDVYPPARPDDLACLPEEGRVRLRWPAVDGAAGYRVSRRGPGEEWRDLASLQSETSFTDEEPGTGTVVYAVRSVDDSGNASEEATCTTVVAATP